jgi:hypothetical protein
MQNYAGAAPGTPQRGRFIAAVGIANDQHAGGELQYGVDDFAKPSKCSFHKVPLQKKMVTQNEIPGGRFCHGRLTLSEKYR